jgi:hypothetical protein
MKVESIPDPSDEDKHHIRVTMDDKGWIALLEWESYATMEELRRKLRKAGVNL